MDRSKQLAAGQWWICCRCRLPMNPESAPNMCTACGGHVRGRCCYVYPKNSFKPETGKRVAASVQGLEKSATGIASIKPERQYPDGVVQQPFDSSPTTDAGDGGDEQEDESIPSLPRASLSLFSQDGATTTQPTSAEPFIRQNDSSNSEEVSDDKSIVTDARTTGLNEEVSMQLVESFANKLLDELDHLSSETVSEHLITSALKHYALLLSLHADHDIDMKAATFVRHRRIMIAKHLLEEWRTGPSTRDVPAVLEKIDILWKKPPSGEPDIMEEEPSDVDLTNVRDLPDKLDLSDEELPSTIDEIGLPDLPAARKFLTESLEFTWLISQIRVSCSLLSTGETFMLLRQQIISALNRSTWACFCPDWDVRSFFKDQYPGPGPVHLSQVLCIVGSGNTVQALPCAEYVALVWSANGTEFLETLDRAFVSMQTTNSFRWNSTLENGVNLSIAQSHGRDHYHITAPDLPTLVEIGEILSWLSCACRASVEPDVITYCSPQAFVEPGDGSISITTFICVPSSETGRSDCWKRLFRNPVVCQGYPVQHRVAGAEGLQITVDIMSTLACITTAVMYGELLLLKGLCSMFVPVLRLDSSIVWHYLANDDYSRMSHNSFGYLADVVRGLDFAVLREGSHYVGWSREVHEIIGRPDLEYDQIKRATLKEVEPGFACEGITIGFSKIIEISTKFTKGKKDSGIYRSYDGPYPRMIDIASTMNVALYDMTDRRAWLMNATSTLLLLVRTALSSPYAPGSGQSLRKAVDELNSEVSKLPPDATAKDILLCSGIRKIALYGDDAHPEDVWHLEKLVLEKWNLLDEMRSRQKHILRQTQRGMNGELSLRRPKSRIEGFDFIDMISCAGPLHLKHDDSSTSTQWSEINTKFNAISIMGCNFGQLLRPVVGECKKVAEVPPGRDIVVAPNNLLDPRWSTTGGWTGDIDCVQLSEDLFWNEPYQSFGTIPCPCIEPNVKGTCGKIVTVLRSCRQKMLKDQRQPGGYDVFEQFPKGAVMFGSEAASKKLNRESCHSAAHQSLQHAHVTSHLSRISPAVSADSISDSQTSAQRRSTSALSGLGSHLGRSFGIKGSK